MLKITCDIVYIKCDILYVVRDNGGETMGNIKKYFIALLVLTIILAIFNMVSADKQAANKKTTLDSIQTVFKFSGGYGNYKIKTNNAKLFSQLIKLKAIEAKSNKLSNIVLGFATYYYNGDKSSYNSFIKNHSMIDIVVTHTYKTDGMGNISLIAPITKAPIEYISFANRNRIKALAMVSNSFNGDITKQLLESQGNRKNAISNITKQLKLYNYAGVNIDFEGIYYNNRKDYSTFIKELYENLHSQGLLLTISIPAKTRDKLTDSWSGAFDYKELAKYSDKIVIMSYDEHYVGGNPGPVASYEWVKKVVEYAVTVMPREKIILGTAAYGYDWSSGVTKSYGINGINKLATKYWEEIMWDSVSKTPYFNYTDEAGINHEVWFENEKSLGYKLDIVNNYRLSGIGIWRLGLENDQYWNTIRSKMIK